jgi:single-strand DNA-binding protein
MSKLISAQVIRASQHTFRGRLTRDPETRQTKNGNYVTNGSLAVNQPGAKKGDGTEPDWFKLEVWGESGIEFADTVRKGDLVQVTGRVRAVEWQSERTGTSGTDVTVTVDDWIAIPTPGTAAATKSAPQAAAASPDDDDDEVPF